MSQDTIEAMRKSWTLRRGKATRLRLYESKAKALEAVGLAG
jgi:hypothetical protein